MNNDIKGVALVAGRNYCNILTTARALGEAGYDVEVLKVFKTKPNPLKFLRLMKPEAKSKYVSLYKEVIVSGNENAVADCLMDMAGDEKKLLVPVDDYVCCAVDNAFEKLSRHYYAPGINNKAGEVVRLMDKNEQKKQAEKYKLPLLDGCVIKSENGVFEIPENVAYPCFIKPNVSMKSTKSKMKMCSDRNALEAVLKNYAAKEDFEILVEKCADIKEEYSLLGLSTGDEAITVGAFRVVKGGNHDRKGVAVVGETVDTRRFEDIICKCNSYVAGLGYVGMFDIDLIEDKNREMYFVELNFRAGASTYALNELGVNVYGMYADHIMLGTPPDKHARVNSVGRFVSEKVLMEEYARGDIGLSDVKKCMSDAQIFFVKNKNDMSPYRYFKKFYLLSALIRLLYKIKG